MAPACGSVPGQHTTIDTPASAVTAQRGTVVLVAGNHHDLYRLAAAVLATDPEYNGDQPTDQDLLAAAQVINTLLQSG